MKPGSPAAARAHGLASDPIPAAVPPQPDRASLARRIARVALRADERQRFAHDWRRLLSGEPPLPPGPIQRVAIVCAGNICRSPLAAALLQRARPELSVASFGLATQPGRPADPRALAFGRALGVDLSGHRTRPFAAADARADLVLAMDVVQGRAIARAWPAARPRVRLLGDFLPARPFAILDPFSRSDAFWQHTCERLAAAVERLAERLERPA